VLSPVLGWTAATVNLTGLTQTPSGSPVSNGVPLTVDITATPSGAPDPATIVAVEVVYRTLATGATNWWNTNAMANIAGNLWRGAVPRLAQGNIEYFVQCRFTGTGAVSPTNTATQTVAVSEGLGEVRFTTFETTAPFPWLRDTTVPGGANSTNWYRSVTGSQWYASGVQTITNNQIGTAPSGGAKPCLLVDNIQGAYLRSPYLAEGVGTLYLLSKINATLNFGEMTVQVTTNAAGTGNWETVQVIAYPSSNPVVQVASPVAINRRDARYVKIYRSDVSSAADIWIDNVSLSYPPADVSLSTVLTPSSPSSGEAVTARVDVVSVDTNVPAINRRATLYYNWNSNGWNSLPLSPAGGNTYQAIIPGMEAGYVEYYTRADFDGYYYSLDPDGSSYSQPTNTENRTPRYTATNAYTIVFQATRIIRLDGSLAFGNVATNAVTQLPLTVYNDGNTPLSVSSVDVPAGFGAQPQTFSVAAGGSSNVTVSFAPSALQAYGGTVTVQADWTSGTNTTTASGTGVVVETVSQPILSGPVKGTRLETLTNYTASATNNYLHGVEYQFSWGNGTTSAWGQATQSNQWSSTGVFSVAVQGRCISHPTVLSLWSAPLSVTITNTRVLRLVGDLSFGSVPMGQSSNRPVAVWNDGSMALQVTNITLATAFTAAPKVFTVQPGETTNVTVTFQPPAVQTYTGTFRVYSDATAGSNTLALAGTGTAVEVVQMLSLTGPSAGETNASLSFTASASNNYGHTLEYRFDWNDGITSSWNSAATAAHAWPAAGVRHLKAEARCATHTTVSSGWYGPTDVRIVLPLTVTVTATNNGQPMLVSVSIPPTNGTVTACTLYYQPPGSSYFQSLTLSFGGGTWNGSIPPLNAGTMNVYVVYVVTGLAQPVTYPASGTLSFTVSASLGDRRYTDFSGWSSNTASAWTPPGYSTTWTNWYRTVAGGDQWYAGDGTLAGSPLAGKVPDGGTKPCLYLRSMQGAYLLSPYLAEGVGTIYFVSAMRATPHSGAIVVQITTSATASNATWETVLATNYPGVTAPPIPSQSASIKLNRRDARYVRIVRTDRNRSDTSGDLLDGSIVIDEVSISCPAADVILAERLRNPGYPSRDQSVKLRCAVTNADALFPAVNRRVKVWYSWQNPNGPWSWTNAVDQGGGALFEAEVQPFEAGTLYYYYQCDFDGYSYALDPDGPGYSQPTNNECLSPVYFRTNVVTGLPLSYGIRAFRSDVSDMQVAATPESASVYMDLVGDYTWQGITLVNNISNLTWRFKGYLGYTNDATAFEGTPRQWGDNNQDFPYPPIAGYAERDATNDMQAILEYNGFLMFRFSTTNRSYIVKRAVYQNFDNWQASQTYFEESLGLYAVKSFATDFTGWPQDAYTIDQSRYEDFALDATNADYVRVPTLTSSGWSIDQAKVIGERVPAIAQTANKGVQLNEISLGRIGNTGYSLTEGVEQFQYKARASVADTYYALYLQGFTWSLPLTTVAKMRASEMSPALAYLSTIVCYTQVFGSVGSFYEVRLIQDDETRTGQTDNHLRLRVFRWDEGSPTEVAPTGGPASDFSGQLTDAERTFTVDVTAGAGYVELSVSVSGGPTAVLFRDSTTSRLANGGTVGFLTFDAVPQISSLNVKSGATTLLDITDFTGVPVSQWYWGGKRRDDASKNRWSVSGAKLTREVPRQVLGVYLASTEGGSVTVPDYTKFSARNVNIEVQSLNYANRAEILKRWDETFVELRYLSGDVPVVVDNTTLTPWRAVTRGSTNAPQAQVSGVYYDDWTSWDTQQYQWLRNEKGWAVLEGWVNTSAGSTGNEVQFDRSRANTNLVQAMVSPVLTNGIGSIAFDYRVSGGQAVWAIERTVLGDERTYQRVALVTNPAGAAGSYFLPIRTNMQGRIRVALVEGTDPTNGVLKLDNLLARDYPPRDDTTWQAYNCLITSLQTNRAFEPTFITHQTCYLNNHTRNGVQAPGVLSEHHPFVQTPKVGTGIGEIAFWYRVWDGTGPGTLELRVAPDPETPEPWPLLTNLTVNSTIYQYYRVEPYDLANKVLRIYCLTNGGNRVCIDNVLMTEPVRAGYEFRTVKINPTQPVEGNVVEVEAEVGRFIMNPEGIRVFLSYHTGTNVWGYTNWWTEADTPGSHKVELSQVGERLYRTASGARIPVQPIDTVVQYVVWGIHNTLVGSPIFQGTDTFSSPAWYAPRNLNTENAVQGWSPYYFVYSCLPGAVWINEVNYARVTSEGTNEYVELVGPANVSLANWKIDLVRYTDYGIKESCTVSNNFRLPDKLPGWGWGFFVWGDPGVPNVNQLFAVPGSQNIDQNGGVRLVRSMGAIEQRICYGSSATSMTNNQYQFIGTKSAFRTAPMHLQDTEAGGTAYTNFSWLQPSSGNYTPGEMNKDQHIFTNAPAPAAYYYVYSAIGPNGRQNGLLTPLLSIQVAVGGSTSIVYTADAWYRISALLTNGVAVAAAANKSNYTWVVSGINGDRSNNCSFALGTNYQVTGVSDATVAAWLQGKSATEVTDTDGYGIRVEYGLNLDPRSNDVLVVSLKSLVLLPDGRPEVTFTVTNKGVPLTSVQAPLTANGFFEVYASPSLLSPSWVTVPGSAFYDSGAGVWRWTATLVPAGDFFYRVVISNP
jgi:hypothetical protein